MLFKAYLQNDTGNWYEDLPVRVTNTNQSETLTLRGDSYDSSCVANELVLSNDYSGANVTLKFSVETFCLGTWEIDGVAFIGDEL